MTDFLRVGSPRLDPLTDTAEESAASRWIRQRAHELIDAGLGMPDAFQQARADFAQLAIRDRRAAVKAAVNAGPK